MNQNQRGSVLGGPAVAQQCGNRSVLGGPAVAQQCGNRLPSVSAALDGLSAATKSLQDTLGTLHARLGPVLSPQPPTPVGNEPVAPRTCELHGRIQSQICEIAELERNIIGMLDRLEV